MKKEILEALNKVINTRETLDKAEELIREARGNYKVSVKEANQLILQNASLDFEPSDADVFLSLNGAMYKGYIFKTDFESDLIITKAPEIISEQDGSNEH